MQNRELVELLLEWIRIHIQLMNVVTMIIVAVWDDISKFTKLSYLIRCHGNREFFLCNQAYQHCMPPSSLAVVP